MDAAQVTHNTLSGIARSRAGEIVSPHPSQVPYVASSSLASARSVRARPASNERPTPISVRRLIASVVPSPIRLPKPCAAPSSGRSASVATRSRVLFRRASSSSRIASRSRSSPRAGIRDHVTTRSPAGVGQRAAGSTACRRFSCRRSDSNPRHAGDDSAHGQGSRRKTLQIDAFVKRANTRQHPVSGSFRGNSGSFRGRFSADRAPPAVCHCSRAVAGWLRRRRPHEPEPSAERN